MKTYSIFVTLYPITKKTGSFEFVAFGEGENFVEAAKCACQRAYSIATTNKYFTIDKDGNPCFGRCRLFDNFADARAAN
jgi:hypothetical protein